MAEKRKSNHDSQGVTKSKKLKFQMDSKEQTSAKEKINGYDEKPINSVKEREAKKNSTNSSGNSINSKLDLEQKPEDWKLFKQQKKELKLNRKKAKNNFDVVVQAKKIGEILRRKQLTGGSTKRNELITELHNLLKKNGSYHQFVLAHDTARIVQWMLKYSPVSIRKEIFKELKGEISSMMQSKYGVFCIKRLLKYGDTESRSEILRGFQGNVVKLASHAVSAPYLEYAFSTWATPRQKLNLVQEFYGDMYKLSKDDTAKNLKDIFTKSPSLKNAILSAIKTNLSRILNKNLLDSGLVHSVLNQFLQECIADDKAELISQLAQHVVVISNSKDGARAAMQCIWYGTNKDRKIITKALKEHLVELCKHEHGHCTIITLLDSADDTVLLNKIVISEIIKNAKDLSKNEWGRKVLLWLIVPDDSSYFHPQFIKELTTGREMSSSKKPVETRRQEILALSSSALVNLITSDPKFWLSDSKLAYQLLAVIKSATGKEVEEAFESLVKVITDTDWKLQENEKEVIGIEQAAMHLVLKKIVKHDRMNIEKNLPTFGAVLVKGISEELLENWIQLNRGCFLLVSIFENNSENVLSELKNKLLPLKKQLKRVENQGAKILLQKLK